MLKFGADPHAVDRFGGTPMSDALRNHSRTGDDAVVRLLKQAIGDDKTHESILKDSTMWFYIFFQAAMLIIFGICA